MVEPIFKQSLSEPLLYFLAEDFSMTGLRDYSIVFLSEKEMDIKTLTLAQAWERSGCFAFLKVARYFLRLDFFVKSLGDFLAVQNKTRFIWIENPNDNSVDWKFDSISTEHDAEGGSRISEPAILVFRNLTLKFSGGCRCLLNPETGDGIIFAPAPQETVLTTDWGSSTLGTVGETLVLPFVGDRAGCLQFELSLEGKTDNNTESDLDRLDVGCRLFFDNRYGPPNSLKSLRYPVFQLENATLNLNACLDPLHPLHPSRCYFAFLQPGVSTATPISSFFRTHLGRTVILTAIPGTEEPKLVLAPCPALASPRSTDPYYLVPSGAFEVGVDETDIKSTGFPGWRLMCGLSGVEYFRLEAEPGWRLVFLPGNPAYLSGFKPGEKADSEPGQMRLTSLATTAWTFMHSPTGETVYYAQPEDAILYTGMETQTSKGHETGENDLLEYLEVPAGRLSNREPGGESAAANTGKAFPMLPLAGLSPDDAALAGNIENRVIAPARRQMVFELDRLSRKKPPGLPDTRAEEPGVDDLIGVTQQGLLARFSADRRIWKEVIFAQDEKNRLFLFQEIVDGSPLKGALQTNRQFLVISDGKAIAPHLRQENAAFSISGWEFDLDPEKWAEYGTILVFKFFKGKSLLELARDPAGWTQADVFNRDKNLTCETLLRIIQEAIERCGSSDSPKAGGEEFRYFVDNVAENANWTGIIAFNCPVPFRGFPPQLEGLAAGIDKSRFFAHHIGINTSPVHLRDGRPAMGQSAFFGLIHYQDLEPLEGNGQDLYRFKVSSLNVLFHNSAVTDFSSRIMLMVNSLFGEPANLQGNENGNNLILNGTYQRHNGQEAYVFLNEAKNSFRIDSHVLEQVEIRKAQFMTISDPKALKPGEKIRMRFKFWGGLRFKNLEKFDVFSFGGEMGHEGELSFADLGIGMAFDPQRPDQVTFTFDVEQMSFDMATSAARPGSLFSRFPLKLTGLLQGKPESKPEDFGYQSVISPLEPGKLLSPWFGLEFELDLGSPGALAAGAGLAAGLLVAWGPGAGSYNVFIGMKLPATSGAIGGFDIEGILKLTMKRIELLTTDKGGYLMKFRNIALSFMGKSLPPKGRTDLWLFGDPEDDGSRTLGWYAAYVKDK